MAISSALAAPGTAATDLLRLEAEAIPEALSERVESALVKLRPYQDWELLMRTLMHTSSDLLSAPNPSVWESTTAFWHATTLRYIIETCQAAGVPADKFHVLQSAEVLDALESRLRPKPSTIASTRRDPADDVQTGNNAPLAKTWGGVYLHGILCSLRTCLHAAKIGSSPDLNARIEFYSTAERRPVEERLFLKETYLAGAAALDAFGRIAQATGRAKGPTIRTGARLLAVAADGSPRRGELGRADRRLVHNNPLAAMPEVKVFIRRATSKARRTRILWLRDPRAIRLMADLREGPGGYQLLRRPNGKPFGLASLDALLRRVTIMAVGQPASYNMLRRANAYAQITTAGRSAQLGRSQKSTQTNAIYHPAMVHNASSGLAAARERARSAAVRAGYFRAAVGSVNDQRTRKELP